MQVRFLLCSPRKTSSRYNFYMDIKTILGGVAAILAFVSSFIYIRDIFRGNSKPHTYTWLIWAIVTWIAFGGQWVSGGGPGAWATGASAVLSTFTLLLSL